MRLAPSLFAETRVKIDPVWKDGRVVDRTRSRPGGGFFRRSRPEATDTLLVSDRAPGRSPETQRPEPTRPAESSKARPETRAVGTLRRRKAMQREAQKRTHGRLARSRPKQGQEPRLPVRRPGS